MWKQVLKIALKVLDDDTVKDVVNDYLHPKVEVETLQSVLHNKDYFFVRVWQGGDLVYNEKHELKLK